MNIQSISLPKNFDGSSFASTYGLDTFVPGEFYVEGGRIYYDADVVGQVLSDSDALNHIADLEKYQRVQERELNSKQNARAIPGWATWNPAEALQWFDDNLSDDIVDSFSIPEDIKNLIKSQNLAIKNMGRMIIAFRDKIWPNLPEE